MSLNIVGTTFVTLRLAEISGKTQPAVPWSPQASSGALLPSPFDSFRSLRTTCRFTGGIPNERPPAMAGTRFESSLAAASRQPLAVFVERPALCCWSPLRVSWSVRGWHA